MTIPLILLSILSSAVVFTANINPLKSGGWFKDLLYKFSKYHNFLDMSYVNKGIKAAHYDAMYLSLFVAFFGIFLSATIYLLNKIDPDKMFKIFIGFNNLSKNKFYIDKIYNVLLYKPFFKQTKLASIIDFDLYDQKFIDMWGWVTLKLSKYSGKADYSILDQFIIDGFANITQFISSKLRKTQSGVIQNYLLGVLVFLAAIIIVINQI